MIKLSLEERKNYIAKIATKVFSRKGYQSASMADVAREAGISKPGIYHYFSSKEEILAYILIRNSDIFLERLKRSVKEIKTRGLSPVESFQKLMEIYAQHINTEKERSALVLRERHQLTGGYKNELYKKEQAIFRLIKEELGKIEDLDQSLDLNVIAFLFIAASHWLGYWVKEDGRLDLKTIIRQTIAAISQGVFGNGEKGGEVRHPCRGRNSTGRMFDGSGKKR